MLTADISKSVVVGAIVGVPAALLIVTLAASITPKLRGPELWRGSKLPVVASLAVFAVGLFNLFNRSIGPAVTCRNMLNAAISTGWSS